MPVVKPVRKGAKLANATEFTTEAAEDIRVGDAITIEYRFGEVLEHTFTTSAQTRCAAYSHDGQKLLVCTASLITVYSCVDYSTLGSLSLHGVPQDITIKPDGSHIAVIYTSTTDPTGEFFSGSQYAFLCVYDASTLELLWWRDIGLSGQVSGGTRCIAKYSATGKYLVTSNINTGALQIYTTDALPYTESAAPVGYQVSSPIIRGITYNHDDSVLALMYSNIIGLYDNTGEYPLEVAFTTGVNSGSGNASWTTLAYNQDESRLYMAWQSFSSNESVQGFDVTKNSITVMQANIAGRANGMICAISPDATRIISVSPTGFAPWAPFALSHVPPEIPVYIDYPDLPERIDTDKLSYALFEPDGNAFVLFGCTADDTSSPGSAYVYSCRKYIRRATVNNTKDAVGVGYAPYSIKAGEIGTVSLLY